MADYRCLLCNYWTICQRERGRSHNCCGAASTAEKTCFYPKNKLQKLEDALLKHMLTAADLALRGDMGERSNVGNRSDMSDRGDIGVRSGRGNMCDMGDRGDMRDMGDMGDMATCVTD